MKKISKVNALATKVQAYFEAKANGNKKWMVITEAELKKAINYNSHNEDSAIYDF